MGSIYLRSKTYWIKYYRNGKPYRESSHSEKESVAKRLLKIREGQIEEGRFSGLKLEKVTFEELANDLINDYKMNSKKSLERAELSIKHLNTFFKDYRAVNITTDQVKHYVVIRQDEGVSNWVYDKNIGRIEIS